MKNRFKSALAALATAVMVGAGAVAIAPAAQADATSFALNGYTFGPNQYVVIDFGTLTRDCDTFWTTSDIYVVPSGSVGMGGALADVSGAPNTLMGTGIGSGVFDEVIAITAPGGTLGPGTYDIIEDTCQNGVVDGSDTILSNAFEVVIPTDVPVLPDPRIQQMKSGATAQEAHFASAAKAYTAFFAATTAYTLISDARSATGFYLTYVCSFLPTIEGSPVSPWCPTVSVQDTVKLQMAVVKTILDRAAYYHGIAADPPDPNFTAPSVPGERERFTPPSDDALWFAVANWADHVSEINELSAAFLGSLEKYQGAALVNDAPAALLHARDIQSYARLLNTALSNETSALNQINSAASSAGINTTTAFTRLRTMLTALETDGLSADDERELRNLGATPAELEAVTTALLEELGSADVPTTFAATIYNPLVSANNQMSAAYTDLGNAMNSIISELEAVVTGAGDTPYPRITSMTTTANHPVGQVRTLAATCADCATIEWDLDDDGVFDDATGASITHTFTKPGRVVIGARGADADGRQTVSFVRANVTTSNRAPAHSAITPAAGLVEVPIGSSQEFGLTATDADGDALTTQWSVGSDAAATGSTYTFTAAPGTAGKAHTITAHTSDDRGRAATTRWTALPMHPDADGDGWHANVDCDDADPAVNPGAAEIAGNGIDDDCDPTTLDTGVPVPSFDVSPTPVIVGEEVTFTDTSTDPDGPIASRTWDLDGDGTADAGVTDASVTHTYATRGDVSVTLSVTDGDGNTETLTRTVAVTDRPVAAFTHTPTPALVGNPVQFTDTSTDADGIASWEWDFAYDGVTFAPTATTQNPQHTFGASATVALRVTDAAGAVSEITTREVSVSGPPVAGFSPLPDTGLGDVARAEHGGQAVLWSSQANTNTSAQEMIDTDYPASEAGWQTGSGLVTNQWAVIDLGREWQIEAIAIQPGASAAQRPQNVRIGVSATGAGPGGHTTVLEQTLANDATLQQYALPSPRSGRWLRYDALDNRGNATYITTTRLQALTGQLGGATVTFQDRSVDGDGPDDIVSWAWDFGDGTTSSEQNPTHTFAAPGDYAVTLTVTDRDGLTSSRTLTQRVVAELGAPTFTVPVTTIEAQGATFRDMTLDGRTDRAIVSRTWTWGDGTTTQNTLNPSKAFPDNGNYDVTLTVTDSHGYTASATQTVMVNNRPPTGNAGPDVRGTVALTASGVVGFIWNPTASASDPSTVDRATLRCTWDYGDGSPVVEIQPCDSTTVRAPHTFTVGTHTATLTITDKDGGTISDTVVVTADPAQTYLGVYPVPGTVTGDSVSARVKLWNASFGYAPIAGHTVSVALGGETRTLTTDANGEALVALPLGAQRELTASFAGTPNYLASTASHTISTLQRPPGDVVFTVDESGSMGGVQARIRENVVNIANQLATELDYRISVMGFGGGFANRADGRLGYLPRIIVPATDDLAEVADAAAALTTGGGTEPGINAIIDALHPDVGLRPGAGTCVVLVGDEPTQQYQVTPDDAAAALAANDAILFSIVTVNTGTRAYQDLATGSGGAVFPINDFANDPQPVLEALLDSCATALVQRPDLSVSIDDGRTDVTGGESLTYTVDVTNVGPIGATGVELTVDLPAGVTFASASEGGTVSGDTVSWPLFATEPGATTIRTVTVTVDADAPVGGSLTATAEAFDDGTNGNDLTPANNVDSDTDTVVAQPTLTVVTEVINDDGGTAVPADFTVTVSDAASALDSSPGDAAGTVHSLLPGAYTVAPGSLAGYTTTMSGGCTASGSVTLPLDGALTCTITHDDIAVNPAQGTLTIVTQVINDDGGTAVPADFTVTVSDGGATVDTSPGDDAGTIHTLIAGAYTVDPGSLAGYTTTIAGDCSAAGAVDVPADGTATCTITHDDAVAPVEPGTLTVITTVVNDDGGTAVPAEFDALISDAGGVLSTTPGDPAGTAHTLAGGTYTVGFTTLAGYTSTVDGACAADGTVVVPEGQSVTCTITHDDTPAPVTTGTLTVVTEVINDDGGTAVPTDFTVTVTGDAGQVASDAGDAAGTAHTLAAGDYTVGTSRLTGYTTTFSGACSELGAVALPIDGALTCTITHDDIAVPAALTVITQVVNDDGGTATPADVTVTVTGPDGPVASDPGATAGTVHSLVAGAYTVGYTVPTGYTHGISGACDASGAVPLEAGERATCVIVLDDIPVTVTEATLTVVTEVVNDDGGTAVPADFTATVTGLAGLVSSDAGDAAGTAHLLPAGAYTVGSSIVAGYTTTFSGACAADGTVTLAADDLTCTITHDDAPVAPAPGTLTVITEVVNAHGGTATPGDTVTRVTGPSAHEAAGTTAGAVFTLGAGAYTVGGSPLAGYAVTIGGECTTAGAVTVAPEGAHSCTITYHDVPASLTVLLSIEGGEAVPADFALTLNDGPAAFGPATALPAGIHRIAASGPEAYTITIGGACVLDGTVTLGLDEHLVCQVTAVAAPVSGGEEPTDPGTGGLPGTGGSVPDGAIWLAALLALGGLVLIRRGRAAVSDR